VPEYTVERTFPRRLNILMNHEGAEGVQSVIDANGTDGVTWVHSYVSADKRQTYCVYDGPKPGEMRAVASKNILPIDSITEVRVLDPYFYR
jgi:Protein of unknown function (DUF4242)